MEGLIPYLLHAMKKNKNDQGHHRRRRYSFGRCLSDTSNRSYRPLVGADGESAAAEGSSSHHRITVSDFQLPPPAALDREHFSVVKSFKKELIAGFPAISPAAKSSKLLMPHFSSCNKEIAAAVITKPSFSSGG